MKVGIDYLNTHDRPGYEIDRRAGTEVGFNGSVEIRALSKTFFMSRPPPRYQSDQDAQFSNVLWFDLNRTETTAGLNVRHQLTPLTSLTLDVNREQDRFEFTPVRDSNSTQISGGVKFDPFALIKGSASFGYRDFQPLSPTVPGYQGSTAAVALSYVALGSTKLGLGLKRDVEYSYDINQPYYSDGDASSIAQNLRSGRSWDARRAAAGLSRPCRRHSAAPGHADRAQTGGSIDITSAETSDGVSIDNYSRVSPQISMKLRTYVWNVGDGL